MTNPIQPKFAWRALSAATPGRAHLLDGIPCQDAGGAFISPRPHLIVCDGRGSAPRSHLGSERAVKAFSTLVRAQEDLLARALDRKPLPDADITPADAWRLFVLSAWRTLGDVQLALVGERGGEAKDYEFTLAASVVGHSRIGCLQVGDSLLVMAKGLCHGLVFPSDGDEASNATNFVTPGASPKGLLRAGLFSAKGLRGIAAFSDGVASRMVNLRGAYPAQTFNAMFEDIGSDHFSRANLHSFLNEDEWTAATGDDRTLALLAPAAEKHTRDTESSALAALAVLNGETRRTAISPKGSAPSIFGFKAYEQGSPEIDQSQNSDTNSGVVARSTRCLSSRWAGWGAALLLSGILLGSLLPKNPHQLSPLIPIAPGKTMREATHESDSPGGAPTVTHMPALNEDISMDSSIFEENQSEPDRPENASDGIPEELEGAAELR